MTIRVAIIGAGVMGADHARIISSDIPGASLHVVCDASDDRAHLVADACGAIHTSIDAVTTIQRQDVDAVLIASPDQTHAELTRVALDHGKPVLCEKPLAETSAACLEILSAETAIGRRLVQVGFMRRFDPPYVSMKAALQSGEMGDALMMHNFHRNVEAPPHFTGQMAITNSAPHEFDAARFVLDADVTAVMAFEPARAFKRACKPVVMVLETSKGQLVTVEVNNDAAYGYDVRGELVCEKGAMSLSASTSGRIDSELRSATAYAADWRPRFAEAYRLQNKAWVASIQNGTPAPGAASTWDGYCAAAIAEAGVEALITGAKSEVRLIARPALYEHLEAVR